MRSKQTLIATLKETPADAEIVSHQLMLRAGLIRKLASGLYTWLPMGLRILHKVENIIREEMDKAGALEVSMPVVQAADLWQESGRWDAMGPELLRFVDRHGRDFCLGPTHEEVITDIVRNEISSYKQLPLNLYQIQSKFRDERRPRFGIMRAREFLMKDAYSFHIDQDCLEQGYEAMFQTYTNIFNRLGLVFRSVLADAGSIGGNRSHEFHVLAESGEDQIVFSDQSDYAANIEMAEAVPANNSNPEAQQKIATIATPQQHTIKEVSTFLNISSKQVVKTLIVYANTKPDDQSSAPGLVALVLRGDHTLNEIKAAKIDLVASPLQFASDEEIVEIIGCKPGSLGPVGLSIPVISDRSAAILADFVCGANKDGQHLSGVNWQTDCQHQAVEDLRNVEEGDPSPDGKGKLAIKRGIEVGHIFQLGTKYSQAMNAQVLNEQGKSITMTMGCYGIGVSRIVAASIEQNYDQNGIIWPDAIAPFHIVIIPLNAHKSEQVRQQSDALWQQLKDLGFDVLLDDRDKKTRPGVKFADMDLIGIPHRLVISDRGLEKNVVEYKNRRDGEIRDLAIDQVLEYLKGAVQFA